MCFFSEFLDYYLSVFFVYFFSKCALGTGGNKELNIN